MDMTGPCLPHEKIGYISTSTTAAADRKCTELNPITKWIISSCIFEQKVVGMKGVCIFLFRERIKE